MTQKIKSDLMTSFTPPPAITASAMRDLVDSLPVPDGGSNITISDGGQIAISGVSGTSITLNNSSITDNADGGLRLNDGNGQWNINTSLDGSASFNSNVSAGGTVSGGNLSTDGTVSGGNLSTGGDTSTGTLTLNNTSQPSSPGNGTIYYDGQNLQVYWTLETPVNGIIVSSTQMNMQWYNNTSYTGLTDRGSGWGNDNGDFIQHYDISNSPPLSGWVFNAADGTNGTIQGGDDETTCAGEYYGYSGSNGESGYCSFDNYGSVVFDGGFDSVSGYSSRQFTETNNSPYNDAGGNTITYSNGTWTLTDNTSAPVATNTTNDDPANPTGSFSGQGAYDTMVATLSWATVSGTSGWKTLAYTS